MQVAQENAKGAPPARCMSCRDVRPEPGSRVQFGQTGLFCSIYRIEISWPSPYYLVELE